LGDGDDEILKWWVGDEMAECLMKLECRWKLLFYREKLGTARADIGAPVQSPSGADFDCSLVGSTRLQIVPFPLLADGAGGVVEQNSLAIRREHAPLLTLFFELDVAGAPTREGADGAQVEEFAV
jgi:hypothetical protein